MYRKRGILCVFAALAIVLTACRGAAEQPQPTIQRSASPETKVPLELWSGFTVGEALLDNRNRIEEAINTTFPNIELSNTLMHFSDSAFYMGKPEGGKPGFPLNEGLQQGLHPDLIMAPVDVIPYLMKKGMAAQLDGLLPEAQIDANRFDRDIMNTIRSYSGVTQGALYALPYTVNVPVMAYDKALFERLRLEPPTDGMTWNQAEQLYTKIRETAGNVCPMQLDSGAALLADQLSLSHVDAEVNADVENGGWKNLIHLTRDIYVRSWQPCKENSLLTGGGVAMAVAPWESYQSSRYSYRQLLTKTKSLNWSIAALPVFDNGRQPPKSGIALMIHPDSKRKREAMQMIAYLTSKEHQLQLSRSGYIPSITDSEVRNAFAADFSDAQDRGLDALFAPAERTVPNPNWLQDDITHVITNSALTDFSEQTDDQVLEQLTKDLNKYVSKKKTEETKTYADH